MVAIMRSLTLGSYSVAAGRCDRAAAIRKTASTMVIEIASGPNGVQCCRAGTKSIPPTLTISAAGA
jgi:hypothetical protein